MQCPKKSNEPKYSSPEGNRTRPFAKRKKPPFDGSIVFSCEVTYTKAGIRCFQAKQGLVYCHFHSSLPLFPIGTISEALTRSPAVSLHRILFACILTQILYDTYNFILYLLNFLCHPFGFPPFDFRFATAGSHHHYINRNLFQYLSLKFHVARGPSAGGAIQNRGGV